MSTFLSDSVNSHFNFITDFRIFLFTCLIKHNLNVQCHWKFSVFYLLYLVCFEIFLLVWIYYSIKCLEVKSSCKFDHIIFMFTHSAVDKRLETYYFPFPFNQNLNKMGMVFCSTSCARWGLCFHLSPALICIFFSVFEILFASLAASENLMIHFWLAQFSKVFYSCTFINIWEQSTLLTLFLFDLCFYLSSILEFLCQFIQFYSFILNMSITFSFVIFVRYIFELQFLIYSKVQQGTFSYLPFLICHDSSWKNCRD